MTDLLKWCYYRLFVLPVSLLARIRPVKKNRVVFLELRAAALSENGRELYDALKREGTWDLHIHLFLQGSASRAAVCLRQLKFLWDVQTANYIVYNESSSFTGAVPKRRGTKIMNTWHGCGAFKKFGYSVVTKRFGETEKSIRRFPLHPPYDLVTVSSPEVVWAFEEAMGEAAKGHVKPVGVSRTDVFFRSAAIQAAKGKLRNLHPEIEGKIVVLYAPTFRGSIEHPKAPEAPDYEALPEGFAFVIRNHPFVRESTDPHPSTMSEHDTSKVVAVNADPSLTISELMMAADICITDYSSLIFEYALLEKPLLFYQNDLEDYDEERGFYYPYEELIPGPVLHDTESLGRALREASECFDPSGIRAFKEKFMSSCDGCATERIIREFFRDPDQIDRDQ